MGQPWEERLHDKMTVATAGGSWSGNTTLLAGYLVGVRVKPLTATTRFDVKIVDRDGFVVFDERALLGSRCMDVLRTPIRSILTVSLLNATADETFVLKLMMEGP